MKFAYALISAAMLPAAACAQTPDTPPAPETPDVTTVTEDCGEGCSRTVTTFISADTDEDGAQTISKKVEVIEFASGDGEDVNVEIDVDTVSDGQVFVEKKVKVFTTAEGEITPEMQAKIDAMIAEAGEHGYVHGDEGDNLVVLHSAEGEKQMRVIVRQGDGELDGIDGDVEVEKTVNEDGSKTIRITPEGSEETTVITIVKEKSSNSDN